MTFFATSPSARASAAVVGTAGATGAATAPAASAFDAGAPASAAEAAGFAFGSSDFFGASLAIVLLQIDNTIRPWGPTWIPWRGQRRPSYAVPCACVRSSTCAGPVPAGPSYGACRGNS